MSSFLFTSKANTLQSLQGYPELGIPASLVFTYAQWQQHPEIIIQKIQGLGESLAVRSSCLREDQTEFSGAGAFDSLLHIAGTFEALQTAIQRVFDSYAPALAEDQVLIQNMLRDVQLSGVVMTRVLADGSPYYVVNYDDESGQSDMVTGGKGASKTVYVYRKTPDSAFDSTRLQRIISFIRSIEKITEHAELDIEFCLSKTDVLHLLQVRPMSVQKHWATNIDVAVENNIDFISAFVEYKSQPHPFLHGHKSILGVMPDWNPAEMLGILPRRLASSLYRALITQSVWREARACMDYKPIVAEELMLLIAGRPYIDTRLSFNSFLPAELDSETSELLVSAWLDRLDHNPQLHDKIEFSIAQTALDFCFETNFETWYANLLSTSQKAKFKQSLLNLTQNCLDLEQGSLPKAYAMLLKLQQKQRARDEVAGLADMGSAVGLAGANYLLEIAYLLAETKELGTLPFAILARHAFIAENLWRTAVQRGALSSERLASFKLSIQTVSGQLADALMQVSQGIMTEKTFLSNYGHLRPNSYDILSTTYAEREGLFGIVTQAKATMLFKFTAKEQKNLEQLLAEVGLNYNLEQLEQYTRQAIAGRELSKFIFTKNLSDCLHLLGKWGAQLGLSLEHISHLPLEVIMNWNSQSLLRQPKDYFEEQAEQGKALLELGQSLKLGYLIRSQADVFIVPQHRSTPNFIGNTAITAQPLYLTSKTSCAQELNDRLICIENADPGFDWIFTRKMAGLVTMFGGTNSHMAIRCAEYGLPAAIGVGEKLFGEIVQAKQCNLVPSKHILQVIGSIEI